MAITPITPVAAIGAWVTLGPVYAFLLRSDVTAIPNTAASPYDLQALEVATGGGYTDLGDFGYGLELPSVALFSDATAGRAEWGWAAAAVSSVAAATVADFRWVVLADSYGQLPLVAYDMGSGQSLDGYLVLDVASSPVITGSYPVWSAVRS